MEKPSGLTRPHFDFVDEIDSVHTGVSGLHCVLESVKKLTFYHYYSGYKDLMMFIIYRIYRVNVSYKIICINYKGNN